MRREVAEALYVRKPFRHQDLEESDAGRASFRLIESVFRGFMGDTFTDQLGEDIFIDQR